MLKQRQYWHLILKLIVHFVQFHAYCPVPPKELQSEMTTE